MFHLERTGLWTAVPISAVLLVSAACNNTEEPSQEQEIDMKEQYLDSLTEVEKDLGDLQSAVLLFFDRLVEDGHYVNSLIHIQEKQEALDETMSTYLDRTTEEGIPEPYQELHVNLLNLKRNHESIVSFSEYQLMENDFMRFAEEYAGLISDFDNQLEQYEEKVTEHDLATDLSTYEDLLDQESYSIGDVTVLMLGLQLDEYLNVFGEYVGYYLEEQADLNEALIRMEEVGFAELEEGELQGLINTIHSQRNIVTTFLDEQYPENAEELHDFFTEEARVYLDVNLLLFTSLEARNELIVEEALNKLEEIEHSLPEKKQEMEQVIDLIKDSIALRSEQI